MPAKTPEGKARAREKQIASMIAKHGSYKAYKEAMRSYGSKGGSKEAHGDKPRGFQLNPELARENGKKKKCR